MISIQLYIQFVQMAESYHRDWKQTQDRYYFQEFKKFNEAAQLGYPQLTPEQQARVQREHQRLEALNNS